MGSDLVRKDSRRGLWPPLQLEAHVDWSPAMLRATGYCLSRLQN